MSSDERLAARAAKGDQRAFEQIYARYHQDLYRFCLAMVGNPQDAQDALQNTMVKVLRGLPGEKREIKLKPWLYRIARNEAVETLRRRRDSVELEPQQIPVASANETAESRDRLRTLLADLEQLPERQRAALVLRELSGLDFEQIGASFGTSAAVARQTLYEARLSLRQLEAGREMRCDEVKRELSDADGRVTRRREIRAHLRNCSDCRAFREEISRRHEDLAALAPLPAAASAGLLHGVLGAKASAAVTAGAAAGSTVVKSVATVAVVAVIGASAADRSGVVDLPLPGGDGGASSQTTPAGHDNATGSSAIAAPAAASSTKHGEDASERGKEERKSEENGGAGMAENAATRRASSTSDAGDNPPGGGYGRSASQRHGRPDTLPDAADGGQQTASGHKPDRAGSPPGPSGAAQGKPSSPGPPDSKPSPPPAGQDSAAVPPTEPPSDVPSKAEGGLEHAPEPAPGTGG